MTVHFINGRPIDLDAHRLAKARAASRGRDLAWHVTRAQYLCFLELLDQLRQVDEGTDHYAAIVDEMKSIPGYPTDVDQDRDTLHFVITDSTPTIQRN
jgi:hypothetical protein